jgi:hypothetical protein
MMARDIGDCVEQRAPDDGTEPEEGTERDGPRTQSESEACQNQEPQRCQNQQSRKQKNRRSIITIKEEKVGDEIRREIAGKTVVEDIVIGQRIT